jgi:hypothetical protein
MSKGSAVLAVVQGLLYTTGNNRGVVTMVRYGVGQIALAGCCLLATAAPALADNICAGTLTGSNLQALRSPVMASVNQPVTDDVNPALMQQFLNGVQAAGVSMAPAGKGNTLLDMTFTVTPASGAASGTFRGFAWMTGMQAPGGASSALQGAVISASIEATDLTSQSLAWIGSIKCTIRTNDPNAVAEHLGELVGHSLGRSIQQQSF